MSIGDPPGEEWFTIAHCNFPVRYSPPGKHPRKKRAYFWCTSHRGPRAFGPMAHRPEVAREGHWPVDHWDKGPIYSLVYTFFASGSWRRPIDLGWPADLSTYPPARALMKPSLPVGMWVGPPQLASPWRPAPGISAPPGSSFCMPVSLAPRARDLRVARLLLLHARFPSAPRPGSPPPRSAHASSTPPAARIPTPHRRVPQGAGA